MKKQKTERIEPGYVGAIVHNESSKLPGHEKRMQGHCERVENEREPNQNIMIIDEALGLISKADDKLAELPIHPLRSKAIDEIDLLEKTTLFELRKAFE